VVLVTIVGWIPAASATLLPTHVGCILVDREIPNRELRCEKARSSGFFARHQERSFRN
jgi:hypothetical protein